MFCFDVCKYIIILNFILAERSSAGLLEFDDIKDAVDVLMNCNHHPIDNPGKAGSETLSCTTVNFMFIFLK